MLKKITGWIDLQYKIIITKYLNIAIAFHQTQHAHVIVVKNGGCNTSHSERVEQAFILNILENNLYQFRYLIDILLQ